MVCKYDKNNIEKHQLKLDDLLEKSFNGVEKVSVCLTATRHVRCVFTEWRFMSLERKKKKCLQECMLV